MPTGRSTVHLPRTMHAQLLEQAERLHRTKGWLVVRAWQWAYDRILQLPTFPPELRCAPKNPSQEDDCSVNRPDGTQG